MSYEFQLDSDMEVPAGGWTFTVPQTGVTIGPAPSAAVMRGFVATHLRANEVALPVDWEQWFEDELCRQNKRGAPWCGPCTDKGTGTGPSLSMGVVARGIKTLWNLWKRGFPLVPQEVADARSATCAACPQNERLNGCWGCYAALGHIAKMLGKRRAAGVEKLHQCRACGCQLELKVWVPDRVMDIAERGANVKYPPNCWRNRR